MRARAALGLLAAALLLAPALPLLSAPPMSRPRPPHTDLSSTALLRVWNKTSAATSSMGAGRRMLEDPFAWWESYSRNSTGVLVFVVPALVAQLALLQRIMPFVVSRLMQYLNPTALCISLLLRSPKGLALVQTGILGSALVGGLFMLRDTFLTGGLWTPLSPPDQQAYAVITGASSCVSQEMAKLLYLYGYSLILISQNASDLKRIKESISVLKVDGKAQEIILIPVDLAKAERSQNIVQELKGLGVHPRVEVVVAITSPAEESSGSFASSTAESAASAIEQQVQGTVALTRSLLPQMIRRRKGRVLFVSSLAALTPAPQRCVHAACQAFVSSFALSLRRELLQQGVLVTLATPGHTRPTDPDQPRMLVHALPGCPEEVAAVLFRALLRGQESVVPGVANKLFAHVACKLLPPSAAALLAHLASLPSPFAMKRTLSKQPRRWNIFVDDEFDSFGLPTSNDPHFLRGLKKAFLRWWYSPLVDYKAIRASLQGLLRPGLVEVSLRPPEAARGNESEPSATSSSALVVYSSVYNSSAGLRHNCSSSEVEFAVPDDTPPPTNSSSSRDQPQLSQELLV